MRFSGNHSLVGIDIGSHSIKVCQAEKKLKRFELKNFGLANLPPSAIVHGAIKEPSLIAGALQTLLAHLNLKDQKAIFAVSGHSVIVKRITFPALSEKELIQTIPYEAKQYIPFDINEVNLDFQVLGPLPEDPDSLSVLLVAAKKEVMAEYIDVLQLSGLEAAIGDVAAFALANAYELNYGLEADPVALVDLGASQTTLVVINQDGPIYTRDFFLGGKQLTEQIQSLGNLSFEEAEKLKLHWDRTPDHLDQLAPSFLGVIQAWVQEIKRALDFLVTSQPESRPLKMVLSGGSSLIPGFPKYLSEAVQLPTELFQPFHQVHCDPEVFNPDYLKAVGPQAAIALGLALRESGD